MITYPGSSTSPLTSLLVNLKDVNGTIVGNTTTNNSGYHLFPNIQNGTYLLEVSTIKLWGGVTASDVLLYQKHIAGVAPLSGIYLASGDVNGSGTLTAIDILMIKKRIANIQNSFPAGDLLFNNLPVNINDANVIYDFDGICYGDANASYIPPLND